MQKSELHSEEKFFFADLYFLVGSIEWRWKQIDNDKKLFWQDAPLKDCLFVINSSLSQ